MHARPGGCGKDRCSTCVRGGCGEGGRKREPHFLECLEQGLGDPM